LRAGGMTLPDAAAQTRKLHGTEAIGNEPIGELRRAGDRNDRGDYQQRNEKKYKSAQISHSESILRFSACCLAASRAR
jgi:hypothetical protein